MPTRKVTEAKDLYLLRYSKKKFVLARNIGVMYHAILLGMRPFVSFKHFLNPYQGVYKHVNETFKNEHDEVVNAILKRDASKAVQKMEFHNTMALKRAMGPPYF